MKTALSHPSAVRPGDTLWLRGGTYAPPAGYVFVSKLNGAPNQPISVRQYPSERAILDATLEIQGTWSWFWGFEITDSYPTRSLNEARRFGIEVHGPNTKLINLTVYDTGQGIGLWTQAIDSEAYGNLIFNNGWQGQDRGHGHGIYSQNSTGLMTVRNNIVLQQFGYTFHAYATNATLNHYLIDRNTMFSSTALVGGQQPAQDITLQDNRFYGTIVELGQVGNASTGLQFNNNYVAGDAALRWWSNARASGNIMYPFNQTNQSGVLTVELRPIGVPSDYQLQSNKYHQGPARSGWDFMFRDTNGLPHNSTFPMWQNTYGFDKTSTSVTTMPSTAVFVERNQYDPDRSHVTIYNWAKQSAVPVDLSSLGLPVGSVIEVRNALNYLKESTLITYSGGLVSVPMTAWSIAVPLGATQPLQPSPFPEYGVFVLRKLPAGVSVNVSPSIVALKAGQQQLLAASVGGTSNTGVVWTVSPAVGTVSSTGVYTAPASIAAETYVTVTATSVADSTKSDSSTIRLIPKVTVSLTPATSILGEGSSEFIVAQVTGTTNTAITWNMQPSNVGVLTTSGRYFAPTSITTQTTVTITATSAVDPTESDSAVITLSPGIGISITPSGARMVAGQTLQLTPQVTGTTNKAVTWSLSPALGSISSTGLYSAPASLSSQTSVNVTATSVANPTRSTVATVLIDPIIGVSVAPTSATVQAGKTIQFSAQVINATNQNVSWSLSSAVGSISSTGLYTAPASVTYQTTIAVTAKSNLDRTKFASATLTITPGSGGGVSVVLTPSSVTGQAGSTVQLTATVTGTTNTAVSWSLSPVVGTISPTGLYTAPALVASKVVVTVTARSNADSTKFDTSTVTLNPVAVVVTPATATVRSGRSVRFTAQVTGTANTGVTWSRSPTVGTLSSTGLYTAPATVASSITVTVTAKSNADPTKLDRSIVTVIP